MQRVSWLNLHFHIPQRDVRKLIYAMLDEGDRIAIQMAHNRNWFCPSWLDAFSRHCAKNGYIDLCEWAILKGYAMYNHMDVEAAIYGKLDILIWLESKGRSLNDIPIVANAAENGHLHVLRWMKENNYTIGSNICHYAAKGGHLNVIEWATEHCFDGGGIGDYQTQAAAAKYGHLHILKWIHNRAISISVYACINKTVRHGHYETFLWLVTILGVEVDILTFHKAAKGGNIKILESLYAFGCEWSEWTAAYASWGGNLLALQWLIEKGCPWDDWIVVYARQEGHAHILGWFLNFSKNEGVPQ